jgi:signal transduction histidine kinase
MRIALAGAVALTVVAGGAAALVLDTGPPALLFVLVSLFTALMFGLTGLLLCALRPGNRLGPLLAVAGTALTLEYVLREYAYRGLPGAATAGWLGLTLDPLFFPVPLALILLVFPDGRLPSRRWRPVAWAGLGLIALAVLAAAVRRGPIEDESYRYAIAWRGLLPTAGLLDALVPPGLILLLAAVVTLLIRVARASGEQRQRLVPLAFAGTLAILFLVVQELPGLHDAGVAAFVVSVAIGFPVALAVGALRYRVWELDRVLVAAIVYGSLTVLITAVYVSAVVGLGRLAGRGAEAPALLPPILVTALVAVLFAPVKDRLGRAARRLVLGVRASPYEALAALPHQLADAPVGEEVLARTARALSLGLGVPAARVRTFGGGTAWFPGPADGELTVVEVRHLGEAVGDVAVRPSPDRALSTADRRLLADLAAQAGPALRGVILTDQLAARLEDLRASRHRIVTAESRGRRRLERDLHDGVQQHLVALAVSLSAAQHDPAALAQARDHLDRCIQDLRDLARGIYPPVLAAQGLGPALRARARSGPGDVRVRADGVRFPEDVELAAYFACLEAMQNAAKHAPGAAVTVSVHAAPGRMEFLVADDGPGFDPAAATAGTGLVGLADRLGAVGGGVTVESAPGAGTRVHGHLPLP